MEQTPTEQFVLRHRDAEGSMIKLAPEMNYEDAVCLIHNHILGLDI
jgi:hypothetical protein